MPPPPSLSAQEIVARKAAHAFKFSTAPPATASLNENQIDSKGENTKEEAEQNQRGKRNRADDEGNITTTDKPVNDLVVVCSKEEEEQRAAAVLAPGGDNLEVLRQRSQRFMDAREWNQFHNPRNVFLALTGEVGEVAELFQWRPDAECQIGLTNWSAKHKGHLEDEIADVFLYLIRLAAVCHVDLPVAVQTKMEKNEAKYPSDLVVGSSAKYTEYKTVAAAAEQKEKGKRVDKE